MHSDFKLDEKASVCVLGILQRETAAIFRVTGFIGLHTWARAAEVQPITSLNSLCQSQRKLNTQHLLLMEVWIRLNIILKFAWNHLIVLIVMHTKAPFRVRHNKPCSCLSVWQSAVSVTHLVWSLSLCLFPACNNICSEADRCEQDTKHCHLITKPHSESVRNTRDCSVCSPVTHALQ